MQIPPFAFHWDVALVLGSVWTAYLAAWVRHTRAAGVEADQRKRIVSFSVGMLLLFAASTWPLDELSDGMLYSAHMVQHMIYQLAAAPLLLVGMPAWMWRGLLRPGWLLSLWRWITRPLIALILFDLVLVASHWPVFETLVVESEAVHFALHVALVVSAIVMWWPVFSPLPELPPVARPLQLIYLFLIWIIPMIPATFMTFADHALYSGYAASNVIPGLTAVSDQRTAGLMMNVGGGLILWGFITYIFFKWYADEQGEGGWDALEWQDVEHDVRAGMSEP